MKKEELEVLTNEELNDLLTQCGFNPLAHEEREVAIHLLEQVRRRF